MFLLVPDVGLICSNTDTLNKEHLLRFFQLGSMSFSTHLFFYLNHIVGLLILL